jgi:hypothetical protein
LANNPIGRYEKSFKSPFPSMFAGGMSEGLLSAEEVCARLEAALASGRADEDWERMVPPEGSIDYLLHVQPMLKQL